LLFLLRQERNLYEIYQRQFKECEQELAAHLKTLDDRVEPGCPLPPPSASKRPGGKVPSDFDLRGELYRISGTDLMRIDGIRGRSIR
jgi:hypothetical protein